MLLNGTADFSPPVPARGAGARPGVASVASPDLRAWTDVRTLTVAPRSDGFALEPPPDRSDEDERLVRRLRGGDGEAFDRLFAVYYAGLCSFATAIVRSPDVAEELIQEVFVDLWKRRESLDPGTSLPRYLYRATKNQALKHLRHQRVEHRSQWQVRRSLQRRPQTPEERYRYRELSTVVHQTIERLPERCRQVFLLSRKSGLTYPEIAEVLEISIKTVETQIGRALKALRTALDGHLT